MYKSVYLEERVSLNPNELITKENVQNINSLLLVQLKSRIESKCISAGFVKPGSIEILHRSMGNAENGRFTGNYIFYIKLRCNVFHPETTTAIDCKVIKVNKMGAYVVFDEAHLIPKDIVLPKLGEFVKRHKNVILASGTYSNETLQALKDYTGLDLTINYPTEQAIKDGIVCDFKIIIHQYI